jgi:AAA15 family ATPase/GTPase
MTTETHKPVIFSDKKIKIYEKIIKEQTAEKKRELNRTLDNKADGQMKKEYPSFLKTIKVKKELDILQKADSELKDFERQLENKKQRLKDAVKIAVKKCQAICERQAKINDWNADFDFYQADFDSFNNKLEQICRDEVTRKLRKSTVEGKQLDEIDNRMKNLLLTLSYPNLKAKAVDLNKALENGGSMLAIALNPDTLKQISNN